MSEDRKPHAADDAKHNIQYHLTGRYLSSCRDIEILEDVKKVTSSQPAQASETPSR
jgi:hypothetical protein